jgi:hypothetical protein
MNASARNASNAANADDTGDLAKTDNIGGASGVSNTAVSEGVGGVGGAAGTSVSVPGIALADGNAIPQIGLGVLRVDDEQTAPVVESALAAGYRHIDGPTRAGHDPRTFSYS